MIKNESYPEFTERHGWHRGFNTGLAFGVLLGLLAAQLLDLAVAP